MLYRAGQGRACRADAHHWRAEVCTYLVRICALTSKGGTAPNSSIASRVAVPSKLLSVSSTLPPGTVHVLSLCLLQHTGSSVSPCRTVGRRLLLQPGAYLLRFNSKTLPAALHRGGQQFHRQASTSAGSALLRGQGQPPLTTAGVLPQLLLALLLFGPCSAA